MYPKDEFLKYAVKHRGISSNTLHSYTSSAITSSMTPTSSRSASST